MPSRLVHTNPQFRERDRAKAQALASLGTATAKGPWMGYVPDLIINGLDLNFFSTCKAIFPRSFTAGGSTGEVLMLEPGWRRVDAADPAASLPLGTSSTTRKVLWIGTFKSTNSLSLYNTVAWTAGDGVTENTAGFWGVKTSDQLWEQITHTNVGGTALRPKGNRDAIPDTAVFAAGVPVRSDYSGAIAQPILIITNNLDPVYVFPSTTADTNNFEDLTDWADPFLCKSVEVFNNRVYYLNTSEGGTRYAQRLRRSPPFTANPDTAAVGSGASDLKDFSGDGLRIERLGTVLVCYFEDGVAFVRATGNYTAPDAFQTVSTSRGLISTHSMVNIGNDLHFGIFSDGWFELDPSGRFKEVGLMDAGNGVITGKWKSTFYNLLSKNPAKRNRLYCHYESATDKVYITIPTDNDDDNTQIWIYDRHADRVFLDEYEALCFGQVERQTEVALTYTSVAPETYTSIAPETYASVSAAFGTKALVHGQSGGFVFQHEPDEWLRDTASAAGNTTPSYEFTTHPISFGNPHGIVCSDRIILEYVNFETPQCVITIDPVDGQAAATVLLALNQGVIGKIHTTTGGTRTSGSQLKFQFSGTGPIMFKSYMLDIFDEKVDSYG